MAHVPKLTCRVGRHSTEVFPLTGYLSISSFDDPAEEDVVVSIGCRLEGGLLECSADVSTGKGAIIAEGPAAEIDLSLDHDAIDRRLEAWLRSMETFLHDHQSDVLAALAAKE
jgi:hypothetical protein